jgi:hypothetical protein
LKSKRGLDFLSLIGYHKRRIPPFHKGEECDGERFIKNPDLAARRGREAAEVKAAEFVSRISRSRISVLSSTLPAAVSTTLLPTLSSRRATAAQTSPAAF